MKKNYWKPLVLVVVYLSFTACSANRNLNVGGSTIPNGGNTLTGTGNTDTTAVVNACNVTPVPTQTFEPGLYQSQHLQFQVGNISGGSRFARTDINAAGFLTFGPYLQNLTMGTIYKVTFRLRLTSTGIGLNGDKAAFIDVYDNQLHEVLAGRTLRRNDFATNGGIQDFDLYAYIPKLCGQGIEGRVYFADPPETAGGVTILEHISTTFAPANLSEFNFDGTGYLPMRENIINTENAVGVAAWINTTNAGGVIFGSQDIKVSAATVHPSAYVPNVYIDSTKRIKACYWLQSMQTLSNCIQVSPKIVADGAWHHIASISNGNSQWLMIDGVTVATNLNPVNNIINTPFNQIGVGFTYNWPDALLGSLSTGNSWEYFIGSMRHPVFFEGGVAASEIVKIYQAGP